MKLLEDVRNQTVAKLTERVIEDCRRARNHRGGDPEAVSLH
jgi:hypothetical protein